MSKETHDFFSRFLGRMAYGVHPSLGKLYEKHLRFFNDGFVELVCLVIANIVIGILSYSFIGLPLVVLSMLVVTPVTFTIKYFLHKLWVWVPDE